MNNNEKDIVERHNEILSIVSHDLKSPMVAIMGFAQYVLNDMKDKPHDPKWEEMLRRVVNAGHGMQKLVEDILSMAKMEAGKANVEPEWVSNLADQIRNCAATFDFEANAKSISLTVEVEGNLPAVRWDMRRIHYHVMNNIVSNALKFTPAGGSVNISARAEDETVQIRISDTGPGIPPNERERIFNRFERANTASHRVHGGAGLGLYNANLFVKRHGGRISVESSGDTGTTFLLELPFEAVTHREPALV
jgi:signal transduction histidine kinase